MGFRADVEDSHGKVIASLPEKTHMAYRTRYGAEMAAEGKMIELNKTKKYAGRFMRPKVYYVGVEYLPHLIS